MRKEIKFGAVLGYINIFISLMVTVFYTPVLLNKLGQAEYGLYSLVASIISYLSVLDMGFGNAMIRFISKSQAREERENESEINGIFILLYTIIGIISMLIGILLFLNVETLFSKTLNVEEMCKAKIIMGILVVTVSVSFPLSVFDSYAVSSEKFTFLKIIGIIKTVLIPLTMLPLLFYGGKSIVMVLVNSFYNIIFHLITMYYCFKKLNMKIKFKIKNVNKMLLKSIMVYSFFIFLGIIVDNVFKNTDQIILGLEVGTVAVSIYAVASQITQMNQLFSTTISGLFLPKITKMLEKQNDKQKVSNMFIKISRVQLYIMMLILSGFLIFGRQFLSLWAGQEYVEAYYIVLILIVPSVVPLTQNIGITILQAQNKHKFRSIVYILIAIFNIFVSIPLAKYYSGIGAAIGSALATILGQIIVMNIYYYKKIKLDIPKYWKFFLIYTLPIGVISSLIKYLIRNIYFTWKTFFIAMIIYVIIYSLMMYMYMNSEEKDILHNLFKKLRNSL